MAVIDGERRVVAVLMADVAGSTAIGERLGPERSKFLFDEVMRLMTAEIERYDGTVAQLLGDGLLAMFGAPVAHEDDSERAVRAGLAIQRALEGYGREVGEAYGVDLRVRIAVNTGPVVVSPADDDGRRYNALGDTVNVAARLQALAGGAEVTLGPQTAAQVRDCFELEELGETQLRGRDAPVGRFRVLGELDQVRRRPSEPLIGRDRELGDIRDALDRVADGIGEIVAVTGEPGIGKSRLVGDAADAVRDRVRILEGRGLSYTESFAYWPIRELLRDWLGAGPTAGEARVRLDLKAALHGLFGDEGDHYPFLAALLGLQQDAETRATIGEFSRDAVHRRSMELVAELICRLARDRPLLLVFEDLHWADEPSLELIESLMDLTEQEPIGLVLLYRTDRERGSWRIGERARQRYPHRYREVELRPLPEAASRALVEELAGAAVDGDVADVLVQRAGGNPLFLGEALRDLIERGALRRSNGSWVSGEGPVEVPAVVQAVLQARLDRLDPPAREVISVAAVSGRRFGTPLLEKLVEPAGLPAALSQLQRLELIVEEQRRPFPTYRFRHGLVQEAAYGALTETRRRELHGRVGRALEQLLDGEGDSPRTLAHLARHFSAADEAERAAHYLILAGDQARALYADEEAILHYRAARRFLQQMGDDRRSRETLFKIALVHHLSFNYPEAEAAYDEAFACKVPPVVQPPTTGRLVTAMPAMRDVAPGLEYVSDTYTVTEHVFSGLLQVDSDLNVMPALAENFRVSADGLSYLFQIRATARWSDGTPVTAHDFADSWERARRISTATAFLLEDVERAEALDDHTLEVTLREPRNYFLYVLAVPPSYPWPSHLVAEHGEEWGRQEPLVSNGPYTVERIDGEHMLLRANPQYDGPRGNLGEVEIRFFRGRDQLDGMWQTGTLDVLVTNEAATLHAGDAEVRIVPSLGTTMFGFHPHAPYDDARVRTALAAAIARVGDGMAELGLPVRRAEGGGLLPPAMPGHTRRLREPVTIEQARQLLADAGYPDARGLGPLHLVIPNRGPQLAGFVEQALGLIGVTANIEWTDIGATLSTIDCDAWFSGWVADYPDPDGFFRGLLSLRHQDVLSDSKLGELLAEARGSRDREERLRLYGEVDHRLVTEALISPVHYGRAVLVRRPHIDGIWANAITPLRFDQAMDIR
jgi:ABC-type transport system substrate-binding protein/class 3 adenylate cyclase